MHHLKRIVTFIGHPPIIGTPKTLLAIGSHTVTLQPDRRYFVLRTVTYDDDMTPLYARTGDDEVKYESLPELKESNPTIDSPILDNDHSLRVWTEPIDDNNE